MKREDVTALILAGGKATRLGGVDKRVLVVDGRTIFDRQIEALAPCVATMSSTSGFATVGSVTSTTCVRTRPPAASMSAFARSARSGSSVLQP